MLTIDKSFAYYKEQYHMEMLVEENKYEENITFKKLCAISCIFNLNKIPLFE